MAKRKSIEETNDERDARRYRLRQAANLIKQVGAYDERAAKAAKAAHTEFFNVRRGFWIDDDGIVTYFDNNPDDGRRERLLKMHYLADETFSMLGMAEASYPVGGVQPGYTIAIIFDGTKLLDRQGTDAPLEDRKRGAVASLNSLMGTCVGVSFGKEIA